MAGLCGLSGLVGIFLFNFIVVCTHCAFLEECLVTNVPLCLFIFAEGRKEAGPPFGGFEAELSQCVDSGLACLVRGAVEIGLAATSRWIFSSHMHSTTGSAVVTATCATTPLSFKHQKQKRRRQ